MHQIISQIEHLKPKRSHGQKGFKFEESWLLWEECEEVVREAWALPGTLVLQLGLEVVPNIFRGFKPILMFQLV